MGKQMKIVVIGANGRSGSLIVEELVSRGFDVTASVRRENQTKAQKSLVKDLYDLTKEDLAEFDVIVDAFGTGNQASPESHKTSLAHLIHLVTGSDKRLIIVDGASSLYMDKEHKLQLFDTPDFPEAYKPNALAMKEALEDLRQHNEINWTYISPAAEFSYDAPKTGNYILAGEEFRTNDKGVSEISYADYAIAFADEIESGKHYQERISVLGK